MATNKNQNKNQSATDTVEAPTVEENTSATENTTDAVVTEINSAAPTEEFVSMSKAGKIAGYTPQKMASDEIKEFLIAHGATGIGGGKGVFAKVPVLAIQPMIEKFGAPKTRKPRTSAVKLSSVSGADTLEGLANQIAVQQEIVAEAEAALTVARADHQSATKELKAYENAHARLVKNIKEGAAERIAAIEAELAQAKADLESANEIAE